MTTVLVVQILLVCGLSLSTQAVDRTLESEASGADVVRAVVNRIQKVFGRDSQFLRRIAFVESKDGKDSNTYRSGYHGGIWQVDETGFLDTQDTASHPQLAERHDQLFTSFKIDWTHVQWTDLRIPLYSGIAARLFLLNISAPIPCDTAGQAAYWKLHYNTPSGDGTEENFIEDVAALSTTEGCRVNTDTLFVLDVSGSIGDANFDFVREFGVQFVSELEIGPDDNQVGVITFDSVAQLQIGLDTYSDNPTLQQAIRDLDYTGGGTNIPAALCQLITSFSNETSSGARSDPSVFRVAILMTDGQSGGSYNPCNFQTVSEAAMAVHAVSPTILVFAFGVGDSYNEQDVIDIASGPQFVSSAQSFSSSQLECVQNVQEEEICNTISTPIDVEEENSGLLEEGEQVRWKLAVPESGTLLTLEAEQGEVVLYASTETTAPNEALHEWKAQTSSSTSVLIKPTPQSSITKREAEIMANETLITVYTAIIGLSSSNTFVLTGDNNPPPTTQQDTEEMTTAFTTMSDKGTGTKVAPAKKSGVQQPNLISPGVLLIVALLIFVL